MSCWTAYLLREADGSIRYTTAKYGEWHLVDAAGRDEVLRSVRDNGVALGLVADGHFDGAYCRGVLLDLVERRYRCFPCYGDHEPLAAVDAAIRAAEVWAGWDAGLATGGREELAEALPEAARVVRPYDVLDSDPPRLEPLPPGDWFAGWDPDAFTLDVRDDEYSAGWTLERLDVLTVVDGTGAARDYRLTPVDTHPVHPLLVRLRRGPAGLEELGTTPPWPPADDLVRSAVVLDGPRHIIHYSPTHLAPARLLAAVQGRVAGVAPATDGRRRGAGRLPPAGHPRRTGRLRNGPVVAALGSTCGPRGWFVPSWNEPGQLKAISSHMEGETTVLRYAVHQRHRILRLTQGTPRTRSHSSSKPSRSELSMRPPSIVPIDS